MAPLHKTGQARRPRPAQVRMATTGDVVRTFSRAGVTYQLQFIRCGNRRCKRCSAGASHGPYWYGFFWSRGATRSKYIGKTLPKDVDK